jgi:hypothetical protein
MGLMVGKVVGFIFGDFLKGVRDRISLADGLDLIAACAAYTRFEILVVVFLHD